MSNKKTCCILYNRLKINGGERVRHTVFLFLFVPFEKCLEIKDLSFYIVSSLFIILLIFLKNGVGSGVGREFKIRYG